MNFLELTPLTTALLPAAVELDQLCLGGLWTSDGYRREIESPNSVLLVLQPKGRRQNAEGKPQGSDVQAFNLNAQPLETLETLQAKELETKNGSSTLSPSCAPAASPPPLLGLGCLWSIADEAHITVLAVHPAYRQQGLGQALLCALLTSAWKQQLKWATLEVRASNETAIALYQKFGFQALGRRKRYYQDNGEDAIILWLNHLQNPEFCATLQQWQNQVVDRLNLAKWQLTTTNYLNSLRSAS